MSERVARAALSRLSEPGDVRLTTLVGRLGANRVYELLRDEQDVAGVYTDVAARLRGLDPARELADAAGKGIRFVCPEDDEWPRDLDDLDRAEPLQERGGAPLGLWVKGPRRLDEACRSAAAVVGSRSATTYGAAVASDLAAHLAEHGVGVVSGAAFGIDQAAHRGALAVKGLTGVVGPNGCGKSNVLEGLRWVMGANSAKAMRGQGMDDVIFAGAANRPPRSHAEVSLAPKMADTPAEVLGFLGDLARRAAPRARDRLRRESGHSGRSRQSQSAPA